jgi:hypothetical protein
MKQGKATLQGRKKVIRGYRMLDLFHTKEKLWGSNSHVPFMMSIIAQNHLISCYARWRQFQHLFLIVSKVNRDIKQEKYDVALL